MNWKKADMEYAHFVCQTHKMCVHPSAPPGFDFSIYMAVYMHVTELHVCKCTINMVFKAILCNKHNTDMHHTDDYMVV